MQLRSYVSLSFAAGLLITAQVAWGQLAYEGFNPSFPAYAAGGIGFSGPWTLGGFNAFASDYVLMISTLRFASLPKSGGSISGQAFSQINGMVRPLRQPLGQDGTTVYVSVLLRPEGTLDDGLFNGFFGLTLNGSLGRDLFIGKGGGGAMDEYVLETRGGLGQVSSGAPVVVGKTALLVVKAEFLAGNDMFTLYVNPDPRDPEPASGTLKTDLDLGVVSRIGIYSSGAVTIDEIRIGTTYGESLGLE